MTPIPCEFWRSFYQNGAHPHPDDPQWFYQHRDYCLELMRKDFNLDSRTPEWVLKDILLENDFTDYAQLLFPEVIHDTPISQS